MRPSRSGSSWYGRGHTPSSVALVRESSVANSVTSTPRAVSPSASRETTCSQGPYARGGVRHAIGPSSATFTTPPRTFRAYRHHEPSQLLKWAAEGKCARLPERASNVRSGPLVEVVPGDRLRRRARRPGPAGAGPPGPVRGAGRLGDRRDRARRAAAPAGP